MTDNICFLVRSPDDIPPTVPGFVPADPGRFHHGKTGVERSR